MASARVNVCSVEDELARLGEDLACLAPEAYGVARRSSVLHCPFASAKSGADDFRRHFGGFIEEFLLSFAARRFGFLRFGMSCC